MASTINGTSTGNGGLISTGDDSGILNIQTNETTAITVDASQNVGIGTSSPSGKLNVSDATSSQININSSANGATRQVLFSASSNTQEAQISANNSTGELKFESGRSGTSAYFQTFYTNNSERMRIDSSGNLLIGVGSSSFGGGIFLQKSSNGNTIANFENTYSGSGGQAIRGKINSAGNNTSSYLFVGSSNNDVCYIYGNGNIVNINNSYGTLSDVKLKENIVDATPKLAEVMQLKVRNFNLKTEPDHKQIGFIAQELEQVFPALIDNTTSPNDPDDVIKSIKTSVLVPILVKAIQELKAINDTQAETINALTARIVALETA